MFHIVFTLSIGEDEFPMFDANMFDQSDDYPIIYRVLTIPGGAGFCPSTVCFTCHVANKTVTSSNEDPMRSCHLGIIRFNSPT